MKNNTKKKSGPSPYGMSKRIRPEVVKLVNKLDKRKVNEKGEVISFSEKVISLLTELEKWRSGGVETEK